MLETIIGFLGTLFSATFQWWSEKRCKKSDTRASYDNLRQDIAAALTMYACCFYNPVDIAKTENHKLPPDYSDGSKRLRELGSKLRALAETMPKNVKNIPVTKQQMVDASGYLIVISNSFTTPYNMPSSHTDRNYTRQYEKNLRDLLDISE